jgi:hypothetical protein
MIIEWANTGRPVFQKNANKWLPDPFPTWSKDAEYSFDPPKEKIKYRVALMRDTDGAWVIVVDDESEARQISNFANFERWLNDWIEVEV